ncbi:MAG: hypothetical protein ACK5AZ_12435 [Bryobacteraceae bacterium]
MSVTPIYPRRSKGDRPKSDRHAENLALMHQIGAEHYDPIPPEQVTAPLADKEGLHYSLFDRYLACVRLHTICYPYRSPFAVRRNEHGNLVEMHLSDILEELGLSSDMRIELWRQHNKAVRRGLVRTEGRRIYLCGRVQPVEDEADTKTARSKLDRYLPPDDPRRPELERRLAELEEAEKQAIAEALRQAREPFRIARKEVIAGPSERFLQCPLERLRARPRRDALGCQIAVETCECRPTRSPIARSATVPSARSSRPTAAAFTAATPMPAMSSTSTVARTTATRRTLRGPAGAATPGKELSSSVSG